MNGKYGWLIAGAVILGTIPGTGQAVAQDITERVEICGGCHGQDGTPTDKTIPVIWGQRSGYIYIQLRDFQRGDRKNEIMQPIASSLERDDMLAIAEYFATKPWPDLRQPRSPNDVSARALSGAGAIPRRSLGLFRSGFKRQGAALSAPLAVRAAPTIL